MTFGVTILFFIVLVSVIPYNFFPGKLFIMNLFLEHNKSSFSKALESRVQANADKHTTNDNNYVSGDGNGNFDQSSSLNLVKIPSDDS